MSIVSDDSTSRVMAGRLAVEVEGEILLPVSVLTKICMMDVVLDDGG